MWPDLFRHTALITQADEVVKALFFQSFEHVIYSLVGESGEEDTLLSCAKLLDNFGDDAGLARSWWSMNEEIILHLQCSLDSLVLFEVKVWARRSGHLLKTRSRTSGNEIAQMCIGIEPAQQVLEGTHVDNIVV